MLKRYNLGEVTTKIGSGATPTGGKEAYKGDGISLIRSLNVYDLEFHYSDLAFIDEAQAQKLSHVTVRKNDVLLNITGASVARCCLAPDRLAGARVNQHVAIIRADGKFAWGPYLVYLLASQQYKDQLLSSSGAGATREALTKGGLEQLDVELPCLDDQKRSASILSAYDDLIENNTRRIAILEEMARRLYEEWFVKFRFPGHEHVQMAADLPAGWQRVPIKAIYEGLYDGPHATPAPSAEGPVFLGIGNITESGRLDLTDVRHISEEHFPQWTRRVTPQAGDIVFTYEATLNRYAIIPYTFRGCLGRRLALIRTASSEPYSRFLYLHFFSTDWRGVIAKNTLSGATVDRIPLSRFPEFPVDLPPRFMLEQFDQIVLPMFDHMQVLERESRNLRTQRDFLLPKLISGEIEVSRASEIAQEAAE